MSDDVNIEPPRPPVEWHKAMGDHVERILPIPGTERIKCMRCGKSVSTPVPVGTIVRAWVECPECIEANKEKP